MTAVLSDLRFAARRLRHSPGFAAAAVLMLALGIGASVAMYSVLQGVVLSGLPYPGGERVVAVAAHNPQQADSFARLSTAEAVRLAKDPDAFEAFGWYDWAGMTVLDGERPREVTINFVSAGFFPALGVAPMLGRTFEPADMGDEQGAVVLSYLEWQRLTGGSREAVGQLIDTANEGRLRIIGVMPPQFAYPIADVGAWRPYRNARLQADQPGYWNARFLDAVGRFPPGIGADAALQRVQALADSVREERGQPDAGWRITATPLLRDAVGSAREALWAAFAVAVLVLLIACANVALLLDARQIARRHEQAVAQAIGATRARLYRVLLLELGLLGLAGAALGIALAALVLAGLKTLAEGSVPRAGEIDLDRGVLLFALAIALATPLLAALMGSLRLRGAPIEAMRSGGGKGAIAGGSRTRALPVLGVALSTLGLVAAAAMAASLVRIKDVEPGFASANVQALQLFRGGGPAVWTGFAGRLRSELAALPGVAGVAVTTAAPLSSIGDLQLDMRVPGRAEPEPIQASVRRVSAGYLDVLGIPLLAGRAIADSDGAGSEKVAVVSRALARRVFDGADPIGRTVEIPLGEGGFTGYRIVGVAGDIRNAGLRRAPEPEILVPFAQAPWVGITFLVRSEGALPGMAAQMREAMWRIDPLQAATREFALADELADELRPARFFASTVGGFALCALLLAALGVYALAAQRQQERRAEFGLRLAIGAQPRRLARQSLAASLRGAAAGIVVGAVLGWAMLALMRAQLHDFGAGYAVWLALAALAMVVSVLLAALPPALRSARVDPMTALRQD
ncbi:MAG: ABC transporter permease [Xanthomonadales bacterium]|nr:ABC transporter permease [Xanthomonadales bacterium]